MIKKLLTLFASFVLMFINFGYVIVNASIFAEEAEARDYLKVNMNCYSYVLRMYCLEGYTSLYLDSLKIERALGMKMFLGV